MKPTYTALIACGLLTAAGFAVFHRGGAAAAQESDTVSHPTGGAAVPAVVTSSPSVDQSPVREGRVSVRPAAAEAAVKKEGPVMPKDMDPEMWKKSSAIVGLMSLFGDQMGAAQMFDAAKRDELTRNIGLGEDGARKIGGLIDARNEELKQASKEMANYLTKDPQNLTELIALGMMSQQNGGATPEQEARLGELAKQMEKDMAPYEGRLEPWFMDEAFMASARTQLSGQELEDFNRYAGEEAQKKTDTDAQAKAELLAGQFQLSDEQKTALTEVYRKDRNAGEEKVLPLLTAEQQADYKAHPNKTLNLNLSVGGN